MTFPLLALTPAAQVAPHVYAQAADEHAVFAMTNSVEGNQIIAYSRAADGSLIEGNHFVTGGHGSGGTTDPLGSQGSLTLSQDHSLLFAVNAGTCDISVFRVKGANLALVQVVPSGGSAPVVIAQHGNLVYVINFAGNSNVVGFNLDEDGRLVGIPNSIRYLSATNTGPSSLAFRPDGRFDVFPVDSDGSLSQPTITPDPILGVFDVVFFPDGAALIVQTGSVTTNASSVSSYLVEQGGTLVPVTGSVPTLGAFACWIALTPNGQFAFASDTLSSSISGFAIGGAGTVTALPGTVVATLPSGSIPTTSTSPSATTASSSTVCVVFLQARSSSWISLPLYRISVANGMILPKRSWPWNVFPSQSQNGLEDHGRSFRVKPKPGRHQSETMDQSSSPCAPPRRASPLAANSARSPLSSASKLSAR